MNPRSLVLSLSLVLSFVLSPIDGAEITGAVRDTVTNRPLVGANVFLVGTSFGDAADENGSYSFSNIPSGDYLIKATYIGYTTKEDSITVSGGQDLTYDFGLSYTTIEGEMVTVSAQARGQMSAINQQLSSRSIVNVVSADRIQELPDANAAESVARLPGVSIKREGGEGNKVVIRGLSPKYNAVTINGIRMASTDSDDRSTDLSMISQYMIEGIEVTKAATPDKDADVLGGTVDFRLKKAPEGFKSNFIAQGSNNALRQTYNDYKLVADVSNRFLGNRFGIVGQIDTEKRNRSSNQLGANYWINGPSLVDTNVVLVSSLDLRDVTRINNRLNGLFVLDANIPDGNISLTNLYSRIDKDEIVHSNSYGIVQDSRSFGTSDIQRTLTVATNSLLYEQQFSGFKVDAFLTHSFSGSVTPRTLNWNFNEPNAFKNPDLNAAPEDVPSFARNDTLDAFLTGVNMDSSANKETEISHGVNVEFDFNFSRRVSAKIKLGNKYRTKRRYYDRFRRISTLSLGSGQTARDQILKTYPEMQEWSSLGTQFLSLLGFMDYNYESVNFLNGNYELGPVSDVSLLPGVYELLLPSHVTHNDWTASLLNDYSGNEEYGARYMMVDLKLGSRINFITGGRYEKNITTYTSTQGYAGISSWMEYSSNRVTHSRINKFWLPMYMLRVRPTDWFDIRFAQTNTLSRPNYTQILPFWYVRPTSVSWKNADLKVARSLNNDLYFSVNQQHIGLLTLGMFTKRIEDLIFSVRKKLIIDPEEYGLDEDVKKRFIYGVTMNNPYAVEMRGMEVDWQTRFWYLPGFLNGFVLNMNYTYIKSKAQYPRTEIVTTYYFEPYFRAEMTNVDTFYTDRLIDQPNNIANIAIGYDRKGFSARLSMLHISQVFQRTDFWKELRQSTDDYTRWDFSVKQDLPWYGLQIYGNINNITGSVDRNLVRGKGFPSSEQHYGRTADIGLRVRL